MSAPAAGEPPDDETRKAPGGAPGDVPADGSGGEPSDLAGGPPENRSHDASGRGPGDVAGGAAGDVAGEAARRARVDRAVRGALAAALGLEAVTVLFVPRAIAPVSEGGLSGGRLAVLLGLAAALLVAAGLQRSRAGIVLGSVLQVAVLATGFLTAAMYIPGLLFGAVWIFLLRVRRELTGAGRPAPTP